MSGIGLAAADDARILASARESGRVCVIDHDFHAHLALAGHGRPSVIFLRVEGLSAEEQADLIVSICAECGQALIEGVAVSADRNRIRLRRLPLR